VTRTDLLEAVAGDLSDVDVGSDPKVTRRSDGSLLIDAAIPMSEMSDLHGFRKLPDGDFVTLAGFVLAQLGHIPEAEISSSGMVGVFGSSKWKDGGSTKC